MIAVVVLVVAMLFMPALAPAVFMLFYARRIHPPVRLRIGMHVHTAVLPATSPWMLVEQNCMVAPAEAHSTPAQKARIPHLTKWPVQS